MTHVGRLEPNPAIFSAHGADRDRDARPAGGRDLTDGLDISKSHSISSTYWILWALARLLLTCELLPGGAAPALFSQIAARSLIRPTRGRFGLTASFPLAVPSLGSFDLARLSLTLLVTEIHRRPGGLQPSGLSYSGRRSRGLPALNFAHLLNAPNWRAIPH